MIKTTQNTLNSRTSIALVKETIDVIKSISKEHNIRIYEVIDAMANIAFENSEFRKLVVDAAIAKKEKKSKSKELTLSQKTKKLSPILQKKLKSLSTEELTELLKKAGL